MTTPPPNERTIGRYKVVRQIGQGGMGSLFLAHDPVIDRLVAIKSMREGFDNDEMRERFAREARAAGRLRHPNIVTIFDVGEHEGQPFIAMEYLPGETIGEIIRRRAPLSVARKLAILEEICDGLEYAHKSGMVHRDIKPANIMVDPEAGLKILDFGIVRLAESGMTQAGMLVGTLNYMSPEQMSGAPVDKRSDIFAVGALAYELFAYTQAFPGTIQNGVMHRIMHEPPAPLGEACPDLDPEIPAIVERALEKDVARRYQHLGAMRKDVATVRERLDDGDEATAIRANPENEETMAVGPTPRPTPKPDSRPGTDRSGVAKRRAQLVERQIESALAAYEQNDYKAAMEAADQAVLIDPSNERANRIFEQAQAALEELEIRRVLGEAREQLDRGDSTRAGELVEQILAKHPTLPEARVLKATVRERRREQEMARERAQLVNQALDRARQQYQAEAYEAAIRTADEVLALQPSHTEARGIREQASAAIAERERREEERRLAEARRREVERQQAEAREARRQQKIASIVETAGKALDDGRLADASDILGQAEDMANAGPAVEELRQRITAAQAEAQRRARIHRRIEERLQTARGHLERQDLEDALAAVEAALLMDPADGGALTLRDAIGQAEEARALRLRQEADDRAREEAVLSALEAARSSSHEAAINLLRSALQDVPADDRLQAALLARETELARRIAEERRAARAAEEARKKQEEDARLAREAEAARLKREEAARLAREAEESRQKREEEARLAREAEAARQKREEAARLAREAEEARKKQEEQARLAREAEAARLKREEEARLTREEKAQKKQEEEARLAREAEAARQKREEEARLAREAEEARKKQEEEARLTREAEAARQKREEEARLAREAEEARKKQEEEARLAREAEAARLRREEEARLAREAEEARKKQEEEARLAREAEKERKRLEKEARRAREREEREEAARKALEAAELPRPSAPPDEAPPVSVPIPPARPAVPRSYAVVGSILLVAALVGGWALWNRQQPESGPPAATGGPAPAGPASAPPPASPTPAPAKTADSAAPSRGTAAPRNPLQEAEQQKRTGRIEDAIKTAVAAYGEQRDPKLAEFLNGVRREAARSAGTARSEADKTPDAKKVPDYAAAGDKERQASALKDPAETGRAVTLLNESAQLYRSSVAKSFNNPDILAGKARELNDRGDRTAALDFALQALRVDQNNKPAVAVLDGIGQAAFDKAEKARTSARAAGAEKQPRYQEAEGKRQQGNKPFTAANAREKIAALDDAARLYGAAVDAARSDVETERRNAEAERRSAAERLDARIGTLVRDAQRTDDDAAAIKLLEEAYGLDRSRSNVKKLLDDRKEAAAKKAAPATPPPTPPPSANPAPSTPAEPSPGSTRGSRTAEDIAAITALYQKYKEAYEKVDAAAVAAVYPNVPGTVARSFRDLQSQTLELTCGRPSFGLTPDGLRATLICSGMLTPKPKANIRVAPAPITRNFTFLKAGGSWLITDVR